MKSFRDFPKISPFYRRFSAQKINTSTEESRLRQRLTIQHQDAATKIAKSKENLNYRIKQSQIFVFEDFWEGRYNGLFAINPESLSSLKKILLENYLSISKAIDDSQRKKSKIKFNQKNLYVTLIRDWLYYALGFKHKDYVYRGLSQVDFPSFQIHNYSLEFLSGEIKTSIEIDKATLKLKKHFSQLLFNQILESMLKGKHKQNFHRIENILLSLNILIDFGNQQGYWSMCLVNSVKVADRPKNPFSNTNNWKRAMRIEKLLMAIQNKLPTEKDNSEFMLNVFKTSLMVDSHLINDQHFKKAIACFNENRLKVLADQLYFSVPSNEYNPDRNLFISPISEFYYHKLRKIKGASNVLILDDKLPTQDFFNSLGLTKTEVLLTGFKSWKHSVIEYWRMRGYPELMIQYLTFKTQSFSLKGHIFDRLFSTSYSSNGTPSTSNDFALEASKEVNNTDVLNDQQVKGLPKEYASFGWTFVRKTLDVRHIPKMEKLEYIANITEKLQNHIQKGHLSTNETLLVQWGIDQLKGTIGTGIISPISVQKRIDAIGLKLIGASQNLDILKLDDAERENLYETALAYAISSRHRKAMLYFLGKFEDWLCERKNLVPLSNYDELFENAYNPRYSVNANIITLDEYEQTKQFLLSQANTQHPEYLKIAILLILGFKLGLRRSEAVCIRLIDYTYCTSTPKIIIKEYSGRKLKTNNATRQFELVDHLDTSEIQVLNDYYIQLLNRSKEFPEKIMFFHQENNLFAAMYHHDLVDPLMNMLKLFCKNEELKFHQLRHSKASLEMLSAFNAQFDLQIEDRFSIKHPLTANWLADAESRAKSQLSVQNHYFKSPYWLHRSMGHAGIKTTLEHYVHVLDIVSAAIQKKHAHSFFTKDFIVVLGLTSARTLERYRENILEEALKQAKKRGSNVSRKKTEPKISSENTPTISAVTEKAQAQLQPELYLRQFKFFVFQQIFSSREDASLQQTYLMELNDNYDGLQEVNYFFNDHPKYRFNVLSNNNLKDIYDWLSLMDKQLLNDLKSDDFFNNPSLWMDLKSELDNFIANLTHKINSAAPEGPIKEYDILCHNIEKAAHVLALLKRFNLEFSLQYRYPEPGSSIREWRRGLNVGEELLSDANSKPIKIKNKIGRMTIKILTPKKSKHFAAYAFFSMLHAYYCFKQNSV